MSKNRPDAGTVDITIQRAIFGRRSVRIRLFWTPTCIFWTAICGFVLWDRNQSVQGGVVRENDADRNSRTCLAARSARRDDSRRDLGRDRAKEAAKMNVERAPCSESPCLPPKSIRMSADERAFLNRLDRLNEEKIKQFTTREIFAYFKIIDKVDSRADVRQWWNARSE